MTAYGTILVGTDGSDSSYRAVERAAAIAGDRSDLVIACAFFPVDERAVANAADALGEDGYQVRGDNPAGEILRTAAERAHACGATRVRPRGIVGSPVDVLLSLVADEHVDLLVVGNKGLNSLAGRLLGSVPSDIARRAKCDTLIVHTVD